MQRVANIDGSIGRVLIDLQAVKLLERIEQSVVGQRRIGSREGTVDVVELLVQVIVRNGLVVLQTLMDVVDGLFIHFFLRRHGHDANDKQHKAEHCQNDDAPQTAVMELVEKRFFLVGISIKLVHNLYSWCE